MNIRKMKQQDFEAVLSMMKVFYASDAVIHKADEDTLRRDISDCIGECPLVSGYVFDAGEELAGFAITACGYSTEYGGKCVWLEDLYLRPEFRGQGVTTAFFTALERDFEPSAVRFRLEVEEDNRHATAVYERRGYVKSPYCVYDKVR